MAAQSGLGFGCCEMGLSFGGDDDDLYGDSAAYREFQRNKYEEAARKKAEREEFVASSYLRKTGMRDSLQLLDEYNAQNLGKSELVTTSTRRGAV